MSYTFRIRDNKTQEIRTGTMNLEWYKTEVRTGEVWDDTFWWTEGNFGCDCNRGMEWLRAAGVPEEEVQAADNPCGHERYAVLDVTLGDGTIIPIDDLEDDDPLSVASFNATGS